MPFESVKVRLRRLRDRRLAPSIPIGLNLGKSKITPLEEAPADYLQSFRRLAPVADYIVLNVSSPNTPGLRSLQEGHALVALLRVVTEENAQRSSPRPLLLKVAPALSNEALAEIIGVCEEFGLAGMIATNTTLDHEALRGADETGGLSGSPLRARDGSRPFPAQSNAAAANRGRRNLRCGFLARETGGGRGASPDLYRLHLSRAPAARK